MRKKLLLFIIVFIIVCLGLYFYAYKGHRDITSEDADFEISVNNLFKDFLENDSLANLKYADKTILIYGKVSEIDSSTSTIIIDQKLSAVFIDSVLPKLNIEDAIKIKGRFVGYDDLLEEFKVDQVTIAE